MNKNNQKLLLNENSESAEEYQVDSGLEENGNTTPWYKTNTFYFVTALVVSVIVAMIYYFRFRLWMVKNSDDAARCAAKYAYRASSGLLSSNVPKDKFIKAVEEAIISNPDVKTLFKQQ